MIPPSKKNELLFRIFGKFVDTLNGRYITAEDIGTTVEDMEFVRMETPFVTADPAPVTAYGVYVGMQACANERWGSDSLSNKISWFKMPDKLQSIYVNI